VLCAELFLDFPYGLGSEKERTTTSSTPSPRTPGAMFAPVRGGRTRMSTPGVSFLGSVQGCTCWLGSHMATRHLQAAEPRRQKRYAVVKGDLASKCIPTSHPGNLFFTPPQGPSRNNSEHGTQRPLPAHQESLVLV